MQANVIVRVFLDSDLRNSHEGLAKLAKQNDMNLSRLQTGQFVVFINHRQTAFKIALSGDNLLYYRNPEGKKIDLNLIALIPRYFDGKEFQYAKAAHDVLLAKLKHKLPPERLARQVVLRRKQTELGGSARQAL